MNYKGIEGDLHLEPQDLPSTLLFPNPARVGTSVQLGQKNENQNWSLWTILGQKLQQGYGSSINTQDLNTGIYYVVTPSKNGNNISRLVIQN
ncbi:MAG: T9SS type A sorting domain-containing protein [Flavobacteriales bacterium]